MTVAPLIAMKSTKCESLEAVGKELDRRAHTYANDVDQSGGQSEDQTGIRVDGRSAPSTLSLPVSRLDETCRSGGSLFFANYVRKIM